MIKAWGEGPTQFFFELTPERVLDSVEASGLRCTGRCQALGSMENRVYELEIEDDEQSSGRRFLVAKYYRPGRWTKEQILDEHAFMLELEEEEVPVIAPLQFPDGETLKVCEHTGIFYTLFPKRSGRSSDEFTLDNLNRVGRQLARIHSVGARKPAPHRVTLNAATYGEANLEAILSLNVITDADQRKMYETHCRELIKRIAPFFESAKPQRIHGDCHLGNLIWRDDQPYFVDFDDMVMGPPVQDFWLLLPSEEGEEQSRDWDALLEGYTQLRDFDRNTKILVEPLRALRYIHFSAWIGKRWEDPAFQNAFPQYGNERYWAVQIQDLREQLSKIR